MSIKNEQSGYLFVALKCNPLDLGFHEVRIFIDLRDEMIAYPLKFQVTKSALSVYHNLLTFGIIY